MAISVVLIMIAISCKKDKNLESNIENKIVDLNKTGSKSEVVFSEKKVQEIYEAYLNVKAGLVNSNNDAVRSGSKKLEGILDDSEDDKQLKATSKLISLTKDIKKQRDFFVTMTNEVLKRASKSKITSGKVFKQYCPMAFDGTGGYWLSDSEEIRNPYFGKEMLICGSVKEEYK